ncbi:hypothetical protein [Wielerella bovis]|uniref:hypothetical protein n=1 Tax=Wielerella bovis TaxID=2917790 RepID=UPI002019D323|nr:hypothetical protein [Wielerella bovis]ULJ61317.1 hypothetical protein MIS44_05595 [Wielerella bovis]
MSYIAYNFIQKAGESAANIHSNIPLKEPLNDNAPLRPSDESTSHVASFPLAAIFDSSPTNGNDIAIQAGDFAYIHGEPHIQLAIQNQSSFTASSVYISLSLYLDDNSKPTTQLIGVPVTLEGGLASGGETIIHVPAEGVAWRSPEVAQAQKRRILAQIVAVGDTSNGSTDYPQISEGVMLTQTKNDWSGSQTMNEPIPTENDDDEMPNNAASSPSEQISTPPIPDVASTPQSAFISHEDLMYRRDEELNLPTGEPRILSHEVRVERK